MKNYKFGLSRDWNTTYNNLEGNVNSTYDFVALNRNLYNFCTTSDETIQITPDWELPTLEWAKNRLQNLYNDLTTTILPENVKKILVRPTINLVGADVVCQFLATSPDIAYFPNLKFIWEVNGREYEANPIVLPVSPLEEFEVKCKSFDPILGLSSMWSVYRNVPSAIIPDPVITYITPERLESPGTYSILLKVSDSNFNLLTSFTSYAKYLNHSKVDPTHWRIDLTYYGTTDNSYLDIIIIGELNRKLITKLIQIPVVGNDAVNIINAYGYYDLSASNVFVNVEGTIIDESRYVTRVLNATRNITYPKSLLTRKYTIPIDHIVDEIYFEVIDTTTNSVVSSTLVTFINYTLQPYTITKDTVSDPADYVELEFNASLPTISNIKILDSVTSYIGYEIIPSEFIGDLISKYSYRLYIDTSTLPNILEDRYNFNLQAVVTNKYYEILTDIPVYVDVNNTYNFSLDKIVSEPYLPVHNTLDRTFMAKLKDTRLFIYYNKNLVISFEEGDEKEGEAIYLGESLISRNSSVLYKIYKDILYKIESLYFLDSLYLKESNSYIFLTKDENSILEINILYDDSSHPTTYSSLTVAASNNMRIVKFPLSIANITSTGIDLYRLNLIGNEVIIDQLQASYTGIIDLHDRYAISSDRFLVIKYPLLSTYSFGYTIGSVQKRIKYFDDILLVEDENAIYIFDGYKLKAYRITYDSTLLSIDFTKVSGKIILLVQDETRIYTLECIPGTYSIDANTFIEIEELTLVHDTDISFNTIATLNQPLEVKQKYIFTPMHYDKYMLR